MNLQQRRLLIPRLPVERRRKNLAGQKGFYLIQSRFTDGSSIEKISPACQSKLPQARVTDSSSRKAVSFSACPRRGLVAKTVATK